jgi:hypothetical protein
MLSFHRCESVAHRAATPLGARWLPNPASNKNFATCLVVDFARARKRLEARKAPPREPRGPAARLARALEWERQLNAGDVASQAEIARRREFQGKGHSGHASTDEAAATRYLVGMSDPLTARDLWPLVLKLPHDERIRLARLALRAAATDNAAAYRAAPPDAYLERRTPWDS